MDVAGGLVGIAATPTSVRRWALCKTGLGKLFPSLSAPTQAPVEDRVISTSAPAPQNYWADDGGFYRKGGLVRPKRARPVDPPHPVAVSNIENIRLTVTVNPGICHDHNMVS